MTMIWIGPKLDVGELKNCICTRHITQNRAHKPSHTGNLRERGQGMRYRVYELALNKAARSIAIIRSGEEWLGGRLRIMRNLEISLCELGQFLGQPLSPLICITRKFRLQLLHLGEHRFGCFFRHRPWISNIKIDTSRSSRSLFEIRHDPIELCSRGIREIVRTIANNLPFGMEELKQPVACPLIRSPACT